MLFHTLVWQNGLSVTVNCGSTYNTVNIFSKVFFIPVIFSNRRVRCDNAFSVYSLFLVSKLFESMFCNDFKNINSMKFVKHIDFMVIYDFSGQNDNFQQIGRDRFDPWRWKQFNYHWDYVNGTIQLWISISISQVQVKYNVNDLELKRII